MDNLNKSRNEQFRKLALLMLIIILADCLIMLLLNVTQTVLPVAVEIIINAMLLACIVGPLFYKQILAPKLREIEVLRSAESALTSSELRYTLVTDNLYDVVFELDNNLTLTFLTPSVERVFGYAVTEVLGTNLLQYLTVESQSRAAEFVDEAFNEYKQSSQSVIVNSGEFQVICKDGSGKWLEVKNTFIFSGNDLERIVGVARDIEARKIVESELTEAYTLLETTFSSLNEAVFIVSSEDRTISKVNNAAEKMFGYSAEELVGAQTRILHLNEEMYERFAELMRSGYSKNGYVETTFQMKRKDGSIFDSEHMAVPIYFDTGICKSHICVVRDISGRVSIEEDLAILIQEVETRNSFLESVITNLQSGIIVVDLDFRIKMVNSYVAEICRTPLNRFERRYLDEVLPELHEMLLAGKTIDEFHAIYDHIQKTFGYSCFDLHDSNGNVVGYIINFKDLTEIIRIRKELRQKERLSSMGEVVAKVAHEMRNPLFGMTAAAQILEMELTLEASQKELMDSLLKESHRLNNLVEELLDTTRETRIKKTLFNLISVLDESLMIVEALFYEKMVSLRKSYESEVLISADFEKLEQVIINLVKNALEASGSGGYISIDVVTVDSYVSVIVTDNGEGIPPENMDRIFDVFYTTKKNGTGMGLSICRGIVEAHGGSLTASNNPDGGAQFVMKLPLGDCQE
jgi:PAS domain S-box-containing protein